MVQLPASTHLSKLEFELDVLPKELGLWAAPDGLAEQLARGGQLQLAHLQVRRMHPEFAKGELFVRHDAPALGEHEARALHVLGHELLEDRIAQPEVDVPAPEALLGRGRHEGDRALVHVTAARELGELRFVREHLLLELDVVEPAVVHVRIGLDGLLVLEALLGGHDLLDALALAVLLLELHVLFVQLGHFALRKRLERVLVDDARALGLLAALLELGEGDEEFLGVVALVELLHRALVHGARERRLRLLLFELGPLDPRAWLIVALNPALKDPARAVGLVGAQLEAHVRGPRVVVGLPLDPPVEDRPRARHVAQHLLHVDELEPKLVDARHERDGAVPHVARGVDVPVAHLHLGILEPERRVAVVHADGTLID